MDAMNKIRRIGDLPGVRKIALQPSVRKVLAQVLMVRFFRAAWDTTTPGLLIRREIFNRGDVGHYRLKGAEQVVWLRHGRDLEALYELIHNGEYEVPSLLKSRLSTSDLRIVDVGANIGMFSAWALTQWPEATITSFEPEPDNAALCREWASAHPSVTLIEAAATNEDGELRFQGGVGAGSYITDAEEALVVPAVDIFPYLAQADFVKIDIEGGEWSILADERMADPTELVLVMEYHRHMAPSGRLTTRWSSISRRPGSQQATTSRTTGATAFCGPGRTSFCLEETAGHADLDRGGSSGPRPGQVWRTQRHPQGGAVRRDPRARLHRDIIGRTTIVLSLRSAR